MRMPNTTTAYLSGGTVTRYIASTSYTGTSKHATGYTVTAHYTGEVDKTGCNMVTYTAYPNRNRDMYFENHKAPTIITNLAEEQISLPKKTADVI